VRETTGYEMSLSQTEFAKKVNNSKAFINIDMKELYNIAETTDAEVITMVGVIEHLQYPIDIMHSLFKNKNVKNILITFPMLSPSVFFEMVFPTVMPRHLAGGHTHLFSEQLIDHLLEETVFVKCSEWWFGTDVMVLIRSVNVRTRQINKDNSAAKTWRETMDDLADELQLVLDKHHVASQVHMLLKK